MRRGDIVFTQLPRDGCVQRGVRPFCVVSNDRGNATNSTVIIAALTSIIKPHSCNAIVSWSLSGRYKSSVLCNHLYTVSQVDLPAPVYHLSDEDMRQVDRALRVSLSLFTEEELEHDHKCKSE